MIRLGTAALLAGLTCASASAQTVAPAAPAASLADKPGTTSDKLKATGGIITPKGDVDPAMHKPAPQTGTMPVIKPGTNGTGSGGLD